MSTTNQERLYELLPAIYRIRDAEKGDYALRALMALIEDEVDAIEEDIDGLYENWFIETCEPWVIPYIGDLLGVRGLHRVREKTRVFNQRAYVANTLAFRRRKGTAAMLEQLARDVTGHPARVVEFFQHLITTQYLNHLRPTHYTTPDLRRTDALDLLGTPFDTIPRTGEVRRITGERGRYNIPNIGIFLWRLQAYPLEEAAARRVRDGSYTFNAFGLDVPLFNVPETEEEITHIAEEINVPGMLRRRALYDELEAYREGGDEEALAWFEPVSPAFEIFVRRAPEETAYEQVELENILICNLDNPDGGPWRRPEAAPPDGNGFRPMRAMVDPKLGRISFPEETEPVDVQVSYAYGFSDDLGGGPYDREESVRDTLEAVLDLDAFADFEDYVDWQVGVSQHHAGEDDVFGTLTEAVQAWNAQPAGTFGVILMMDNGTYEENIDGEDRLLIPEGSTLLILAADWPLITYDDAPSERIVGQWDATECRPHLFGDLSVRGTASSGSSNQGRLLLNGLAIEGELRVLVGNLGQLRLSHCTLIADQTSVEMRPSVLEINPSEVTGQQNTRLAVIVEDSICGPINLPTTVPSLYIKRSLLDMEPCESWPEELIGDELTETVIYAPGTDVEIEASTILGRTRCDRLEADDTLFVGEVNVEQRQVGCVRFSYVPPGSRTPRRYRCEPESESRAQIEQAEKEARDEDLTLSEEEQDAIRAQVEAWMKPRFHSTTFGDPAYAQLRRTTPVEIRTGAEGGLEMGGFNNLQLPKREENLRASLDEYLRFGLEAGLFYVT